MSSKEIAQLVSMPDETNAEVLLKTTKNIADIFNFVPVIGASISKALEYSIEGIYQKRLAEFIQNINKAMQELPERIYSSEDFADVTRITVKSFIEESSKVKRDNIVKIYTHYVTHGFNNAATHKESDSSMLDSCLLWEKVAVSLSEGSFLFFLELKEAQEKFGKEKCTEWYGEIVTFP